MTQTDFITKVFNGNKKLTKKGETKEYSNGIDTKVALLEMSISNINDTLQRIEKRFDRVDDSLKEIKAEMKYDFRWLLAMIIGGNVGLFGLMTHGFHWF